MSDSPHHRPATGRLGAHAAPVDNAALAEERALAASERPSAAGPAEPVEIVEPAARPLEPAVLTDSGEQNLDQYSTGQLLKLHEDDLQPVAEPVAVPYGQIAVALGVLGLFGGLFVGWAFPSSIGAIVFGVLAKRRSAPHWSSRFGVITGLVGLVFGGVWLLYYLGSIAA